MTKRITVTLTEDQTRHLRKIVEFYVAEHNFTQDQLEFVSRLYKKLA